MCQVMDNLAAPPVGVDTADEALWTGWPATTSRQDGANSARKRVLIPYNGTRTADGALDVAADWCQALTADAWVLYVRPWDPVRGGGHIFIETPSEARAVAHTGVGALRAHGVSASAIVRDATRHGIADTIVLAAEALEVSSVVMGTPGRRGLTSALLGSTSLAVARRSHCPVILVKVPKQSRPTSPDRAGRMDLRTPRATQPGDRRR
jgi:nucleotide-binding universal stress UspA family protein